jgi:hypothetical protein
VSFRGTCAHHASIHHSGQDGGKKEFPPRLNHGSVASSTIPRTINHRELQRGWQSRLGLYRPYLVWKALASRLQQLQATKTSGKCKSCIDGTVRRPLDHHGSATEIEVTLSCLGFWHTSIDTGEFQTGCYLRRKTSPTPTPPTRSTSATPRRMRLLAAILPLSPARPRAS